ncbi:TPA: hypothetical protein ACJI8J_004571 [Kluyvera georgiana]
MGLFKKIKKAVKKVVKSVTKPVEQVAKGAVGAVTGGAPEVVVQAQDTAPAEQSAVAVDVPNSSNADTEVEDTTESAKRKINAGGKRSLSISRSSGTGINL